MKYRIIEIDTFVNRGLVQRKFIPQRKILFFWISYHELVSFGGDVMPVSLSSFEDAKAYISNINARSARVIHPIEVTGGVVDNAK